MKFFKAIVFGFILLYVNSGFAQSVVVDGVGTDKESALREAMRNAVEQVVGTFVDSKTLTNKAIVELDEICTTAQGFVTKVKILDESMGSDYYRIRAEVEVNSSPDSQLRNKLAMLLALNDPRIGVIVFQKQNTSAQNIIVGREILTEAALNEKLLSLGFNHVADADLSSRLYNSEILYSLASDGTLGNLNTNMSAYGIDYLILGQVDTQENRIILPDNSGIYKESLLVSGRAGLNIKLLNFTTGEIISTFNVEEQGIDTTGEAAMRKALQTAADKAAEKIAEAFQKAAAKPTRGIQLRINCIDEFAADDILSVLRSIPGINNVHMQEYKNNKILINIDTSQQSHFIVQQLRKKIKSGIFVESISNSSIDIVLS